jgi:stage IV sporulation protein FB
MLRIRTKIPITIHTAFWIFAAIIGFFNSLSLTGTIIWVGIIFVSVLVHELGHAFTALLFGQRPRIELVALGGLTYHEGEKLPFWKQFFIALDGPVFGFLLFVLATIFLQFPSFSQGKTGEVLSLFQKVNLFWTILNLVPVMPLDGGQLLRVVLEGIFGIRGFKYSLIVGMTIAVGMSLFFFLLQYFLVGAIFFLLAYQSYESWKQSKALSEIDRKEEFKIALEKAEATLQEGKREEAASLFEEIRKSAKRGMIYNLATQYLAFINFDMGKSREAYDLLLPIKSDLANDSLCILQKAAFEQKDYTLVADLAGACYQIAPSLDAALRNAFSCAELSQTDATVGWLETSLEEGLKNLPDIVKQKSFDAVRNDPFFKEFLEKHL